MKNTVAVHVRLSADVLQKQLEKARTEVRTGGGGASCTELLRKQAGHATGCLRFTLAESVINQATNHMLHQPPILCTVLMCMLLEGMLTYRSLCVCVCAACVDQGAAAAAGSPATQPNSCMPKQQRRHQHKQPQQPPHTTPHGPQQLLQGRGVQVCCRCCRRGCTGQQQQWQ